MAGSRRADLQAPQRLIAGNLIHLPKPGPGSDSPRPIAQDLTFLFAAQATAELTRRSFRPHLLFEVTQEIAAALAMRAVQAQPVPSLGHGLQAGLRLALAGHRRKRLHQPLHL